MVSGRPSAYTFPRPSSWLILRSHTLGPETNASEHPDRAPSLVERGAVDRESGKATRNRGVLYQPPRAGWGRPYGLAAQITPTDSLPRTGAMNLMGVGIATKCSGHVRPGQRSPQSDLQPAPPAGDRALDFSLTLQLAGLGRTTATYTNCDATRGTTGMNLLFSGFRSRRRTSINSARVVRHRRRHCRLGHHRHRHHRHHRRRAGAGLR